MFVPLPSSICIGCVTGAGLECAWIATICESRSGKNNLVSVLIFHDLLLVKYSGSIE